MSSIDGATAIIKSLERQGVEYIFGYSGGAIIPILDAIVTSGTKIKYISVRHEQGAAHMADGYARATGKPGVVLVTSGPAAGNVVSGLMTAHMDSVPMVVITGQQIRSMLGYDAFQEADTFHITAPVTKHNYLARETNDLPRIINEAFRVAQSGRPGPVVIDIPKDVSAGEFSGSLDVSSVELSKPKVDSLKIDEIIKEWSKAKRPVILAGHGIMISGGSREFVDLVEKTDTPVVNTLLGKGSMPEFHRLSLGMLGMHGLAWANKAVAECDFLLNIGSRFDDRIVGKVDEFCKDAFIAHIDIDSSELNKVINTNVAIEADAKDAIKALMSRVSDLKFDEWNRHLDEYKGKFAFKQETDSDAISMSQVIRVIDELIDDEAIVSTDVGQHQMRAAQFCKLNKPDKWLSSGGAGTMGFGFPAAIGAQLAYPDKTVVAFVGDGGFQMTLFEIATACIHKLPIKVVIMNNHYQGMVRQWQDLFFDGRESGVSMEGNPDFVALAESYGAAGMHIEKSSELKDKLTEAMNINDRPVFINVEVERKENVFPMIPAGAGLSDMLVSAPTKKLDKPTGST